MTYDINTVPKSYQRLFGTPPKDIELWKRREYERWTSNVWNTWILQVSEEDKIKYRLRDLQEKIN